MNINVWDALAMAVGRWVAYGYVAYATGFLMLGAMYGLHAIVLVAAAREWRRPSAGPGLGWWLIDLAYGLLNPVVYLIILNEARSDPEWTSGVRTGLTTLAWILLALFWGVRLTCPAETVASRWPRRALTALLAVSAFIIVAHGVIDLSLTAAAVRRSPSPGVWSWRVLFAAVPIVSVVSLYLVPIVRIATWVRAWRSREVRDWGGLLLPSQAVRAFRGSLAVLVFTVVVTSVPRWSGAHARAAVLAHGDDIRSAAAAYDVDPIAIAAVLYVTQRDQLSPVRDLLERSLVSAWSLDEKNNFLSEGLNISLGIMQVKPVTLQTTARIRDHAFSGRPESDVSWSGDSKQMRGVPQLDATWQLPADPLRRFSAPWSGGASRPRVVEALLDDRRNIQSSALILALYQLQWEAADPSWSIRARPDLLATLYQIGFERSRPHAAPRSNRFGQRVLEATRLPWLRDHF